MISSDLVIIAEIGSIHDGSFGNAIKAVEAVALCGADIAKFQLHIGEKESLPSAPSPSYFNKEPRIDYFNRTSFTQEQWLSIKNRCMAVGVQFMASPFSLEAVEILEDIGVDAYKVPSGEVTNIPLLRKLRDTNKHIYLSSGMSTWTELDQAVNNLNMSKLTVMQCTSMYPCPTEFVGLNIIAQMQARYNVPIGFSDHTLGIAASIAAVSLGAAVVEKHFTFSKLMYGSDAKHSMEPAEFKNLCSHLREARTMLLNPIDKNNVENFREMKIAFEKSIVSSRFLKKGTIIKPEHLAFKKPGTGFSAAMYDSMIGKTASRDIEENEQIKMADIQ